MTVMSRYQIVSKNKL